MHFDAAPIGPASIAAKRQAAAAASRVDPGERIYPAAANRNDTTGDGNALAATRALLYVRSREEAADVLRAAVDDMGGCVVPARLAGPEAIPVDVSLGVGEPMLVLILDPMDLAGMRLTSHLPVLVEDALSAARRCDGDRRQRILASVDSLTGVATRAEIGPRLLECSPGDVVCMLDLDGLNLVNDTLGHAAGDDILHALGEVLRAGIRSDDFVGRFGGDEFLLILAETSLQVACERMSRLSAEWVTLYVHRPGVSIGVAAVDQRGAVIAGTAAETALYRAKRLGKGRVQTATSIDYLLEGPAG